MNRDGGKEIADKQSLTREEVITTVPNGVRIAAAWSWRVGAILVLAGMLVWLFAPLRVLIIPLLIAILLTALLLPAKTFLIRHKMPNGLATAILILALIAFVSGALALVGRQLYVGFRELWDKALEGLTQIQQWLESGPLQLSADELGRIIDNVQGQLESNSSSIVSGALNVGSTAGEVGAGLLLTIFALIFILLEGEKIWNWIVKLAPVRARTAVDGAARKGWKSLTTYVRVQVFVAAVDAVGIAGLGALIGVPLALPLGVLIFIGSFIPIVGALFTGFIAVLLALVANGFWNAIAMLAIVLLVQQVESHILQPLVMGKAVHLHPLAVVLAVSGGTLVAGIAGALFAVPLMAFLNTTVRYLGQKPWRAESSAEPDDLQDSDTDTEERPTGVQDRSEESPHSGTHNSHERPDSRP